MTVCVAAITNGIVFGASDRMLTAGDIQFEPQQPKIYPLSSSIVVQIAGDASIQSEIIQKLALDVSKRIAEKPDDWWNVKDVAELYRRYYDEVRLTHSEHNFLAPFGLDRITWLSKQGEMDAGLVKNIATELLNFALPPTAAIFSGVDTTGAHIYVARDGNLSCQDSVSFASIGAGEWHANSQLMFAGHSRNKPIPETLLLVYSAKKRAEVAPGVGKGTDMFAIGQGLGTFVLVQPDILDQLEKIYQKEQECHLEATKNANKEAEEYTTQLAKRAAAETQAKELKINSGEASPNANKV